MLVVCSVIEISPTPLTIGSLNVSDKETAVQLLNYKKSYANMAVCTFYDCY